ncbi:MAG: class C sortase [Oscillospiraceae bacterium]|nr:class C sortase [Oscillospiraceae bacterium]
MRKHLSTIILFFILFLGIGILAYPTFSDYWNSLHQSRAIASYTEAVANVSKEDYSKDWDAAAAYNADVAKDDNRWMPEEESTQRYTSLLNITGSGIMGYIEIPDIKVSLPIYHGTDDAVLQIAIGHIEGSSLPTGGAGTHCVVSGHRGLPSAKLFTDLDKMELGDIFIIRVLDEIMTYEVDQVLIVEPYDLSALSIDPEQDYVTLVTCTPYGINTHRMLVRGHRIENVKESVAIRVVADAEQISTQLVAIIMAAPLLLLLFIVMMIRTGRQNRRKRVRKRLA